MATSTLHIDLDALAANWQALDAKSSAAVETAAVVKANGYGLGAAQVAKRLLHAGVKTFFVAAAEEGIAVRDAVGPVPVIGVFGGHMKGDTDIIRTHRLTPMLNSIDQITRHFERLEGHPFGIQLDSGMNRLGLEAPEWNAVRAKVLARGPWLVMSHLACADAPNHPMNARQLANFCTMTDGIAVRRALSATGGILLGPDYHFDLVRPGIGLYGGLPYEDARPVVRLSCPVIQTREVEQGETVGYSNTWTAESPAWIATVSAGYADGITRAISNSAVLFAGDVPCPLVGRVSMDLITVDISHLREAPEQLDLLCAHQTVDDIAEIGATIGYEILTSLGQRFKRVYKHTIDGGAAK
ncbi:Alanine racemase, biosynthetic [Aquimixticola soesokkakensis]|uniref:Alanine racemase n=1 Tax=Aquimixticola soesokkakensis TaxID=1519096 RepID=A0A1Y5S119_9RHOB|nr:alanine racemase [Aquimixticola soesokkakensis]SLN29915.1 Alanine racemase, biosynthetic [Aquimixticola soesokkakensis]